MRSHHATYASASYGPVRTGPLCSGAKRSRFANSLCVPTQRSVQRSPLQRSTQWYGAGNLKISCRLRVSYRYVSLRILEPCMGREAILASLCRIAGFSAVAQGSPRFGKGWEIARSPTNTANSSRSDTGMRIPADESVCCIPATSHRTKSESSLMPSKTSLR